MSEELIEGGTAAAQIIEAARARKGAKLIDVAQFCDGEESVPMLAVPMSGGGIGMASVLAEVKAWRELRRERPDRREGKATLGTLDSFIDHANRFKDADSAVWISGDPKAPSFTSVLDYHEAVNTPEPETKALPLKAGDPPAEMIHAAMRVALPRFGKHRGVHAPEFSDEWKLWTKANGVALDQAGFSALIENGARDVVDIDDTHPERVLEFAAWFHARFGAKLDRADFYASSARLLEMSESLVLTIEEKVGEVSSRNGGSRAIIFEGETRSEVGVPTALLLELPIFRGGDLVQVPARIRVNPRQKGDGSRRLEFVVSLYGLDRVVAKDIADMSETIKARTGLPIFVGAPE